MTKTSSKGEEARKFIASSMISAFFLSGCSALDLSQSAQGDVTAWKCSQSDNPKDEYPLKPYEYIIATPGDLIAVANYDNSQQSVILKTNDRNQPLPAGWIIDSKYTFEDTKAGGFVIYGSTKGYDDKPLKQELALNTENNKLKTQSGERLSYLKCERVGNWKSIFSNHKSGPGLAYIESRLSQIPMFRKKIGEPEFTSKVAIASFDIEDYKSAYSLLSPLPTDKLSTKEKDLVEASKNKLIDQDTSTVDIWSWNRSWNVSGSVFYTSEQMSNFCSGISSSTGNYEGYQIISSAPQDRIAARGLTCHGTLHVMKKQGSLQSDKAAELI